VRIKLSRHLSLRPELGALLVTQNILPKECCTHDALTGRLRYGGGAVAPALVGVRRRVEMEKVRDSLRRWLAGRKIMSQARAQAQSEEDALLVSQLSDGYVRRLVRRFAHWEGARAVNKRIDVCGPPRAGVLGLRRFWEGVARRGVAV